MLRRKKRHMDGSSTNPEKKLDLLVVIVVKKNKGIIKYVDGPESSLE